jgi:peptidoglycan-N-acetylglucosamine deacetylase
MKKRMAIALLWRINVLIALSLLHCLAATAQTRTVALTFDDLPVVRAKDPVEAQSITRSILDALKKHHAPAIGFVNEKTVQDFGSENGRRLLAQWVDQGFDLGNHTFSHADLNDLTLEQFQQEVATGEESIRPLLESVGKKPRFFRFPYSHTGDTKEKHDAVAAYLKQSGYRIAVCTVENEDYLFNAAYSLMLAKGDLLAAKDLRMEYLAYTITEIDYYSRLHKTIFGHEIPQVMVLHANRLNADTLDAVLTAFEARKFHFVALEQAQSNPPYAAPDTFVSKYGPMWAYRWAKELGIKVDGSLETEPPAWITQYGPAEQ